MTARDGSKHSVVLRSGPSPAESTADMGGSSIYSEARTSETVTSSGTSAATAEAALAGEVVTVTAVDGSVYVAFGATPTASSASHDIVVSGTSKDFRATAGHKVAVVDA